MTRLRATAIHFFLSFVIGILVFVLIRLVWYPGPLFTALSASGLLALIIGVDVVLGPALTVLVFNPAKPRHLLVLDLTIISCLQMAALAYGVWTTAESRPAYIVLYGRELQVVRSTDVSPGHPFQHTISGPVWVYLPNSESAVAELDTFIAGLMGRVAPIYDTTRYRLLDTDRQALRAATYSVGDKLPLEFASLLTSFLNSSKVNPESVRCIPVTVQNQQLLAVLDKNSLALVALLGSPITALEN